MEKERIRRGATRKGKPNKITRELRERIKEFLDGNADKFMADWQEIESPVERCKLYIAAARFILPSLQAIDVNDVSTHNNSLVDTLKELGKQAKQPMKVN